MKPYNTLLAKTTLSFIVGILLQPYIHISLLCCILLIFITYSLVGFCHLLAFKTAQWSIPFGIGLIFLFILLGIANKTLKDPLQSTHHYANQNDSTTHTYLFSIQEKLKPSAYQHKFIAQLHQKDSTPINGKVLLSINKDSSQTIPAIGRWYYVRTTIAALPFSKNPYQFDYGTYLKKKQIYGQFFINGDQLLKAAQSTENSRVVALRFRESVINSLKKQPFSNEQLAIIQALLLGQRQDIDTEMSNQYASAGMMHILAVSGLHVGILLLLLRFMTRPISIKKWRWIRSGMIIGLLWCFACITGLSPSVLRAVTMFSFLELGSCLGGKRRTHDALLFSAFILLVIDPSLLYQVGFQLSYLAVIAILWLQPWLSGFYRPKNYILDKLWGIITVSIAAQVGVLPLSLFYFHQFPGLFLISNIVVLPFLGILLSLGILVVSLSYFGILPNLIALGYGKIIDALNYFIGWVASKENFVIDHIAVSFNSMLLWYLVIITFFYLLKKYQYKRLLFFLTTLTLMLSIHIYQKTHREASHLTIFHKNKETLMGLYSPDTLIVYTDDLAADYKKDSRIEAYQNNFNLDTIYQRDMPNYFSLQHKKILVIDSLGVYKIKDIKPTYILLRQSPDIHLERLISLYPNTIIIADGSNYKSDISRWKTTCLELKIPFHSTYEKGFFRIQ
ncbi:ComEC/Rec2 family competence protein [Dokdonia ponticola]|uniref:ComEC/Rec2 family competence protein n=1 Tax=Dokdonia ponticola TaxID=2041041 RepID=A0ABV9HZ71_9FLAO